MVDAIIEELDKTRDRLYSGHVPDRSIVQTVKNATKYDDYEMRKAEMRLLYRYFSSPHTVEEEELFKYQDLLELDYQVREFFLYMNPVVIISAFLEVEEDYDKEELDGDYADFNDFVFKLTKNEFHAYMRRTTENLTISYIYIMKIGVERDMYMMELLPDSMTKRLIKDEVEDRHAQICPKIETIEQIRRAKVHFGHDMPSSSQYLRIVSQRLEHVLIQPGCDDSRKIIEHGMEELRELARRRYPTPPLETLTYEPSPTFSPRRKRKEPSHVRKRARPFSKERRQ